MPINIHTLGDSTIDNLYWMLKNNDLNTAKKLSVEGQLREMGHQVISHAYDGFTTRSVLGQDRIGDVLPRGPAYQIYMKEKAANRQVVAPLEELQQKISEKPNDTHHVAISVGGNDFRVNLGRPWSLIRDIPQIQARHAEIVDKVKGLQGRNIQPILILQYRTDANHDPYSIYTVFGIIGTIAVATHLICIALLATPLLILGGQISLLAGSVLGLIGAVGLYASHKVIPLTVTKNVLMGNPIGMSTISALIQSFYQPILAKAKEERIPILDLSNTFNPYEKLYESGIEPNEEGGRLIAKGIDHIVKHHDFTGESMLYSKPSGTSEFVGAANSSDWKVALPIKP